MKKQGDHNLSLVSFVKVPDSDQLKQSILDSLELINYQFPKNIKNVVIKPNMCYYWDHTTGQTTDPKFVANLIQIIRDEISPNVNISLVESDASAMRCKYAFKILGYEKLAKDYNVNLVNLSEDKSEKVEVTAGGQHFEFMMPETIKNADLRINAPKIKYLAHTKISCALKNIFGCNPIPKKFKYHPKIDETIIALNKIMNFRLCILDGQIVLGNKPKKLSMIMASQDIVAFDSAAAKLLGVNPKSIRHIMLAKEEGLGNLSFVPKGEGIKFFENQYPRKGLRDKILFSAYQFATRTGLLDTSLL